MSSPQTTQDLTDATAPSRPVRVVHDANRGIPFTRLLTVELRKQLDTRAGRALLIIIAAVTALILIPFVLLGNADEMTFMSFIEVAVTPQMMILPVIGIMAATSEWSQRTGMTTFALEPRRTRVVGAKLLSALGLGVASFAVAIAFAALTNVAAITFRGAASSWSIDWSLVGGAGLLEMLVIAQGVAFGLLLLNTPAALVTYYILPTVWTILLSVISWLEKPAQWLDMSVAAMPLMMPEGMSGDGWAKLAVATAVWVGLPFVLGTLRVLRREVK